MLSHAKNYQIHLTQVISIGPGQEAQDIHRDQWAFDFFPFPQGYEVQCNLMWAGCDFTEEIGATRIILGSNMEPDTFKPNPSDTQAATMSKGSVLVYSGALFHGGGANQTSDQIRHGINITYGVGWVRQEENQYLTVPHELAATFDEPLLRLMGYARGAYALGYIDDLRDPIEAVRPDLKKTGFGDSATRPT